MGSHETEDPRESARETDGALDAERIDVTLIDETLRMTPEERLLLNDRMIRTVTELRSGFGQTRR